MGLGVITARYVLFLFNFILALAGLGILILLLVIAHYDDSTMFKEVLDGQVSAPTLVLGVIGGCVFLFAFFGCCGALRDSYCMVITYACLLMTVFLLHVAVAVLAFNYKAKAEVAIGDVMEKVYGDYSKVNSTKKWIDEMQEKLHCCGSTDKNTPWGVDFIPDSCKVKITKATSKPKDTPIYYDEACIPKVINMAKEKLKEIGMTAVGVGIIEVVVICLSLYLASGIRHSENKGFL